MTTAYKVIGLDLSLGSTGVAWPDGTVERIRTYPPAPRNPLHASTRFYDLRGAVIKRAERIAHDILVGAGAHTREVERQVLVFGIEGYSYSSKGAQFDLAELGGIVRNAIDDWHHPAIWVEVTPGTVKKRATGKGSAPKAGPLAAAIRRLDYQGDNDDEADAMWVRQCVLAALGDPDAVDVPASHEGTGKTSLDPIRKYVERRLDNHLEMFANYGNRQP